MHALSSIVIISPTNRIEVLLSALSSLVAYICTNDQWWFYRGGLGGWSLPKLAVPHPLVLCLDDTKFH